jgi:hypothetical protein
MGLMFRLENSFKGRLKHAIARTTAFRRSVLTHRQLRFGETMDYSIDWLEQLDREAWAARIRQLRRELRA